MFACVSEFSKHSVAFWRRVLNWECGVGGWWDPGSKILLSVMEMDNDDDNDDDGRFLLVVAAHKFPSPNRSHAPVRTAPLQGLALDSR